MKVHIRFRLALSGPEKLLLSGLDAATGEMLSALAMGSVAWLLWPGLVPVTLDWGGFLIVVRYATAGIFVFALIPVGIEVYARTAPFWRLAKWVHRNEVLTGQLSLFPHRYCVRPAMRVMLWNKCLATLDPWNDVVMVALFDMAEADRSRA